MIYDDLEAMPAGHYGVLYVDPASKFKTFSDAGNGRSASKHYKTMTFEEMGELPIGRLAAPDCVLLIWTSGPFLRKTFDLIDAYGFEYKTMGFDWMKADTTQLDLFQDENKADMKMGYWTRANSEQCLLATRGRPRRLSASVRSGIIEPAREHSRKPDRIYHDIRRLVAGPYAELFARTKHPGWDSFGNEVGVFK